MIRLVRNWWVFWVTLFDRKESATTWALYRIAVAACVLLSLGLIRGAGMLDILWVSKPYGGYLTLGEVPMLWFHLGPATVTTVHALWAVAIVGAVALLLGVGGRVTAFCTLQAYLALTRLNHDTIGGHDCLISNALWLLVLCDGSKTLSLGCWWRTRRFTSNARISAWPRYMAVFQLVVVYTWTGLQKVSPTWFAVGDFSALYYVFQDPTWRRYNLSWTAFVYPLTQLGTIVTWFFEAGAWLLLPFFYYRYTRDRGGRLRALFNRWDIRKPFTDIGVALHLGIAILLDVGAFSWITLSYYFCLWGPEEIERLYASLTRRVVSTRAPASSALGSRAKL
ncbi:MAG: HTTM domain-containing protein [Polyangiales bacterium]